MAEKILIAELDFNVDGLIRAATEAQHALDELKNAQKALGVRTEENTQQFIENEVAQKKVRTTLNEHKKALVQLSDAGGRQADVSDKMNAALTRENTSIEVAQRSNRELTQIKNKLNLTTDAGRTSLVAINKQIDNNTDFIRENSDAATKQKMDIGGYRAAILSVFPQLSGFVDGLEASSDGLKSMSVATKGATAAIGFKTKALLVLKKALIATGIGAIVVALGAFVAFLLTTQKGIDAVTSVTRPAVAVFQSLLGVVQKLGGALFDIFSPGGLGRFFGTVKDLGRDTGAAFSEGIKHGSEIDRLTKEIEKTTIRHNAAQVAVNDELDRLRLISRDTSRSFAEREEASLKMIDLSKRNGQEEAKIIELQIQRLAIQNKLHDRGRKGQEEMVELQRKLDDARDRGIEQEQEQIRVLAGARREAQKQREDAQQAQQERNVAAADRQLELYKRNNKTLLVSNKIVTDELLAQELERLEGLRKKEIEHRNILRKNGELSQIEYNNAIEDINHEHQGAVAEANEAAAASRAQQAQKEAEQAIELANRELELYKRNNRSRLDGNKFVTDELLAQELARLEALRLKEAEHKKMLLENGKISQAAYNAAIEDINHQHREAQVQAEAAREQARMEKEAADFELSQELRVLRNESMFKIMRDDELRRHQISVAQAEKTGADINLLNQKHAELNKKIDQQESEAKLNMASNAFAQLADIFGKESTVGKAMSAAQAKINTYLAITEALKLPFPANIAGVASATVTGFAAVRNILNTRMPVIPKAEKGALFEVGGKRHSTGGTKFYGEDGTTFEAERDELIGVMSRAASEKFMKFNNQYTPGRIPTGNYFAKGGVVSRGASEITQLSQPIVLPSIQVDVKDIIREVQNRVTLVDLANI